MKKIIMAIAALILLLGGGAAVYFFVIQPKAEESSKTEEGTETEETAESQDKGHKKEHKKADKKKSKKHGGGHGDSGESAEGNTPVFVELQPISFPIIDDTGVNRTLSIVITLEVSDESAKDTVQHMLPKLRDAFLQKMYGNINRKAALMKEGVIQIDVIKGELQAICDRILGKGKVKAVLLQLVKKSRV